MPSPFDPLAWGWSLTYALEVEGVPVRWSEIDTGAALDPGVVESACLDVDGSGEVGQTIDRDVGLGAGLPLTFRLMDFLKAGTQSAVSTWIRRDTAAKRTALTSNVIAIAPIIHVASTTGWPASGNFWLGNECIGYTKVTGTEFGDGGNPCTRGLFNSLPSLHFVSTVGGVATDLPRYWRGRQVRLWAYATDPTGFVCDNRFEIWRGHISTGPDRDGAGWQFEALSLDRRLAEPAVPPITGRILATKPAAAVHKADALVVLTRGYSSTGPSAVKAWGYTIKIHPYAALTDGTVLTPDQQRQAISAAWAAAIPLAANEVGGALDAATYLSTITWPGPAGISNAYLNLVASVPTKEIRVWTTVKEMNPSWNVPMTETGTSGIQGSVPLWTAGTGAEVMVPLQFPSKFQGLPTPQAPVWDAVIVQLDTVDAVAPSTGTLTVDGTTIWYAAATTADGIAILSGLYLPGKQPVPPLVEDAQVELGFTATGNFPDLMRNILESSGTSLKRGAFDAYGYGQGYALRGDTGSDSAIDEASFTTLPGTAASLQGTIAGTTQSFADLFGGVLALSRMGVVARAGTGYSPTVQLRAVQTASAGGDYTFTITDAHLLTGEGDPVKTVRRRVVPNALTVQIKHGNDDGDSIRVSDQPAIVEQGKEEITYTLPMDGTQVDATTAAAWAASILLASQTAQAIELRVVPWVTADVGDVVRLNLTHWGVWSWNSGTSGYTGPGRVIGRSMDLKTCATTLTVLVDAAPTSSLCPAAEVQGVTGLATAPTALQVPDTYLLHLQRSLQFGGSPVKLLHYEPGYGAESAGGSVTYTTVTDLGTGNCELTGLVTTGATFTAHRSYLTLPAVATANAYQTAFAHTQDGTSWQ
jgi:hypothetical protein